MGDSRFKESFWNLNIMLQECVFLPRGSFAVAVGSAHTITHSPFLDPELFFLVLAHPVYKCE